MSQAVALINPLRSRLKIIKKQWARWRTNLFSLSSLSSDPGRLINVVANNRVVQSNRFPSEKQNKLRGGRKKLVSVYYASLRRERYDGVYRKETLSSERGTIFITCKQTRVCLALESSVIMEYVIIRCNRTLIIVSREKRMTKIPIFYVSGER